MASFEDLALKYVLSDGDDNDSPLQAATAIESAANRLAVGQWVVSINRWMTNPDDTADDDLISRAKALEFLARTLEFLKRSSLKPDQVKLLVGFFNSLFSSDHRAGMSASSRALKQLTAMDGFRPSLGSEIIMSVVKLGDDFKRQTPATRLEIYDLVLNLLSNPLVAEDLAYQHGNSCGFMTALVGVCRSERDPQNLMKWFEILRLFLQNFLPAKEVLTEVFTAFSDYFPITLRASITPSGITVDDLKGAVRACFASHYRIAEMTIPFLLNKLDQGDAVTVTVKVDILLTLEACLAQYEHTAQGVVPYANQIWASLKYEVRNGEIRDTIDATLKAIGTLAKRLPEADLRTFFSAAWRDLGDDLSNATYTIILIVSRDRHASHYHYTETNETESHQADILALLNSLLQVRSALTDVTGESVNLKDELFGDQLFEDGYARIWDSGAGPYVLAKAMDGMASLASQRTGGPNPQLICSQQVCEKIFRWLALPSIIYPLEGKSLVQNASEEDSLAICNAATTALRRAVPSIRLGFNNWCLIFCHKATLLNAVALRLARIGCSATVRIGSPWLNSLVLINGFLQGLHGLLKEAPVYWIAILDAIHMAILRSADTLAVLLSGKDSMSIPGDRATSGQPWITGIDNYIQGLPQIDLDQLGDLNLALKSLGDLEGDAVSSFKQFQGYSIHVVAQLYRRFTSIKSGFGASSLIDAPHDNVIGLSTDFRLDSSDEVEQQDRFLYQLARMATSVMRSLSEDIQQELELVLETSVMFHGKGSESESANFRSQVSQSFQTDNQGYRITFSPADDYRTAPLGLGILQGLWPGALSTINPLQTIVPLCEILMKSPTQCAGSRRIALDAALATLSNKSSDKQMSAEGCSAALNALADGYTQVNRGAAIDSPDVPTRLAIFKSVLHFLAGDIARYRPTGAHNWLLRIICDTAPSEITIGRQLAQCFGILVSPKECLTKPNHAHLKPFRGQWIYQETVRPYFDRCFPSPSSGTDQGGQDDRCATNRSVAIFAILRHLKYNDYSSDADQIVRVVIRSLATFGVSDDINAVMTVLCQLLEHEPERLKEHLTALVTNTMAVYKMARSVDSSLLISQGPGKSTITRSDAGSRAAVVATALLGSAAAMRGTEVASIDWKGVNQRQGRRCSRQRVPLDKQKETNKAPRGPTYLISFGGGPLIHDSLLHKRDPVGEDGVYHGVDSHSDSSVVLGVLEAELVVPGEAGAGDDEGRVAEDQSRVD
ncbi:DNA repair transcription protein [Apiospora phragmitis]|uniref:MMS19 nucleotide excision repair protein n=1 Tax=Apiospora phragmitis TaxID=2905665 RepID=A0ABR1TSK6_9PEZI